MEILLIMLLMFGFMYVLLIRPQRQQQRRHTEMLENLKVGDEVVTTGGIYGDVTEVQADRVSLEIAEDVEIEVVKRAIASVVPPEEAGGADEDDELAEATAEDEVDAAAAAEPTGETEPAPEAKLSEEDAARR